MAPGGGALRDTFNEKDHYYTPTIPISQLPQSKDLRIGPNAYATPPYDQGYTGSCTANAATAAFWYEEKAGRANFNWGSDGPSRLFVYWEARAFGYDKGEENYASAPASDSGSEMRNAMKGLALRGACPEADCKFPDVEEVKKQIKAKNLSGADAEAEAATMNDPILNAKPSQQAYDDANNHKIGSYFRIDPDRPDAEDHKLDDAGKTQAGLHTLMMTKQCLAEGYPVAFGFWYYLGDDDEFYYNADPKSKMKTLKNIWDPDHPTSKGVFPRNKWITDLPEKFWFYEQDENGNDKLDANGDKIRKDLGGHSVLAIGYDDKTKNFLVQNSWGEGWSDHGVFYMPYDWVSDFAATNDFWTVRVTPQTQSNPAPMLWQDKAQLVLST